MKKFIKYEIKGNYKFILGILAIVIIASTIIQFNISKAINIVPRVNDNSLDILPFMFGISILVIFGAFLTAFFYIVNSFRKELYEDRGYLTFTLPLTGNQILGSKLIVSIIWFALLGLGTVLYNLILVTILHGTGWLEIFEEIGFMVNRGVFSLSITGGLGSIMTLILIYLSMALSKVTIKNKKIGGLWFVIFLVMNALTSYIIFKIGTVLPLYLNLSNFTITNIKNISMLPFGQSQMINDGITELVLLGSNYQAYLNLTGLISQLTISVVAFVTTGYLIEKRIDL